jgi:hypothetical protein
LKRTGSCLRAGNVKLESMQWCPWSEANRFPAGGLRGCSESDTLVRHHGCWLCPASLQCSLETCGVLPWGYMVVSLQTYDHLTSGLPFLQRKKTKQKY